MTNAVCCSDHVHCCPHNTRCDVAQGKCLQGNETEFPWAEKVSAKLIRPSDRVEKRTCPGPANVTCHTASTCCPLERNGASGCCPVIDGQCCSDRRHCCPRGTRCARGHCLKSGFRMSWTKIAGLQGMEARVSCLDGSHCPSESTCCPMEFGYHQHYSCCPTKQVLGRLLQRSLLSDRVQMWLQRLLHSIHATLLNENFIRTSFIILLLTNGQ
jgi:hypothetical protein